MDNKAAMSGNYSFVVEDKNTDGFYEAISFQFQNTFVPWTRDYLGSLIYPEHILGDPTSHGFNSSGDFNISQWIIHPANWSTHSTSTGRTTDLGGYAGPIGTGSMVFKEYNTETGAIILEKFENKKWDGFTWITDENNDHYNINNLGNMPLEVTIIIEDQNEAFTKLKNGEANILDPNYDMNDLIDEIRAEEGIKAVYSVRSDWQGLWMNPKFNQDGIYHFQKKGVRHAISHMIPREDFVDYLFNGLAQPSYTVFPTSSWDAITTTELIVYKQSLLSTDGTTPEVDTTTAYDEYSIELALNWLDSEGYDTTKWHPTMTTKIIPGFQIFTIILSLCALIIVTNIKRQ